jgi:hypothetical protein
VKSAFNVEHGDRLVIDLHDLDFTRRDIIDAGDACKSIHGHE